MDIFMLRETFMANVDPRRRQEASDARMVSEDPRAVANLSGRFIQREFNPDKHIEHLWTPKDTKSAI